MKRNREASIIVEMFVETGLIEPQKTDRARYVAKEAMKKIRRERFEEKQKN